MLNEREKREQLFVLYLWNASKQKLAKLHVLEAPKNGHVGDVARPSLPQKYVEEPVPSAVWLQRLGCFFFSRKEKFLCAHGARACNSLACTRQSASAR